MEGSRDIVLGLGDRIYERYVVMLGRLLAPLGRHYSLIIHVALVAHNHLDNVLVGVLVNIAQPLANAVEGLAVGDVVDEHDAHRAAIIRRRDRVEALLARRVPDLQLDLLAIQIDGLHLEVDANGRDERGVERVVGEAAQYAGLAHARVADEQDLEQVVIALLGHLYIYIYIYMLFVF